MIDVPSIPASAVSVDGSRLEPGDEGACALPRRLRLLSYGTPASQKLRDELNVISCAMVAGFVLDTALLTRFGLLFVEEPHGAIPWRSGLAFAGGLFFAGVLGYLERSWLVSGWNDEDSGLKGVTGAAARFALLAGLTFATAAPFELALCQREIEARHREEHAMVLMHRTLVETRHKQHGVGEASEGIATGERRKKDLEEARGRAREKLVRARQSEQHAREEAMRLDEIAAEEKKNAALRDEQARRATTDEDRAIAQGAAAAARHREVEATKKAGLARGEVDTQQLAAKQAEDSLTDIQKDIDAAKTSLDAQQAGKTTRLDEIERTKGGAKTQVQRFLDGNLDAPVIDGQAYPVQSPSAFRRFTLLMDILQAHPPRWAPAVPTADRAQALGLFSRSTNEEEVTAQLAASAGSLRYFVLVLHFFAALPALVLMLTKYWKAKDLRLYYSARAQRLAGNAEATREVEIAERLGLELELGAKPVRFDTAGVSPLPEPAAVAYERAAEDERVAEDERAREEADEERSGVRARVA